MRVAVLLRVARAHSRRPLRTSVSCVRTVAQQQSSSSQHVPRMHAYEASTNDPLELTDTDAGRFYVVSADAQEHLDFEHNLKSPRFIDLSSTLGECRWIARRASIDTMRLLDAAIGPSMDRVRLAIFGRVGCGKSVVLAQLAHYAYCRRAVLVHVPSVTRWSRANMIGYNAAELAPSAYAAERVDMPIVAQQWLAAFVTANQLVFDELSQLRTTKSYEFSHRERVDVGVPLTELLEFGRGRAKFASDVMGGLLRELRFHASKGDIEVIVTIDHASALWGASAFKREDRSYVPTANISLCHHLLKMITVNWTNGAVAMVMDQTDLFHERLHTVRKFIAQRGDAYRVLNEIGYEPPELIGLHGMETIDPFVPVHVDNFERHEADAYIDYLANMRYITDDTALSRMGRDQLIALSAGNAALLDQLCATV